MSSMLAAVRGAMTAPTDDDDMPETGATGADAPHQEGTDMSDKQPPASAGITQADLDRAVASAVAAATLEGRRAEAARIAGIEANALPGHEALIAAHKADPDMTPEKSAVAIVAAERKRQAEQPNDVRNGLLALDKAAAGIESRPSALGDAGAGAAQPKATPPEGWKAEWEKSAALQAEYPTAESYVATRRRDAARQQAA